MGVPLVRLVLQNLTVGSNVVHGDMWLRKKSTTGRSWDQDDNPEPDRFVLERAQQEYNNWISGRNIIRERGITIEVPAACCMELGTIPSLAKSRNCNHCARVLCERGGWP